VRAVFAMRAVFATPRQLSMVRARARGHTPASVPWNSPPPPAALRAR
jgi:hypothetical protein